MNNELTVEQRMQRYQKIKAAAKVVEKERAEAFTKRRQDAEFQRDLREAGFDIRDLEGLV